MCGSEVMSHTSSKSCKGVVVTGTDATVQNIGREEGQQERTRFEGDKGNIPGGYTGLLCMWDVAGVGTDHHSLRMTGIDCEPCF